MYPPVLRLEDLDSDSEVELARRPRARAGAGVRSHPGRLSAVENRCGEWTFFLRRESASCKAVFGKDQVCPEERQRSSGDGD